MTPTSPDSGNTSFGYSDATSSISSRSNTYGDRRRELSMPPPSRHRVNLNGPTFPHYPDGTIRRRELMPFDSYLYPGNFIDRFIPLIFLYFFNACDLENTMIRFLFESLMTMIKLHRLWRRRRRILTILACSTMDIIRMVWLASLTSSQNCMS